MVPVLFMTLGCWQWGHLLAPFPSHCSDFLESRTMTCCLFFKDNLTILLIVAGTIELALCGCFRDFLSRPHDAFSFITDLHRTWPHTDDRRPGLHDPHGSWSSIGKELHRWANWPHGRIPVDRRSLWGRYLWINHTGRNTWYRSQIFIVLHRLTNLQFLYFRASILQTLLYRINALYC